MSPGGLQIKRFNDCALCVGLDPFGSQYEEVVRVLDFPRPNRADLFPDISRSESHKPTRRTLSHYPGTPLDFSPAWCRPARL
jgi:hypothetical protein